MRFLYDTNVLKTTMSDTISIYYPLGSIRIEWKKAVTTNLQTKQQLNAILNKSMGDSWFLKSYTQRVTDDAVIYELFLQQGITTDQAKRILAWIQTAFLPEIIITDKVPHE